MPLYKLAAPIMIKHCNMPHNDLVMLTAINHIGCSSYRYGEKEALKDHTFLASHLRPTQDTLTKYLP